MSKARPEEAYIEQLLGQVPVKELMNESYASVEEEGSLSDVQLKFVAHRTFYVIVINHENQLVGLISQKYLYKTQSPRRLINPDVQTQSGIIADDNSFYSKETLDSYRLTGVMNQNPTTLRSDATVAEAVTLMKKRNIGCIIITNNSRVVQGVLTHQEIVNYLAGLIKS